jgi:predicted ribosomally synthesized peptide with nif11-like leader
MSKKDTEDFLEVIAKDTGMKKELQEVYSRALLDFAQTKGFHFTMEELVESIKDRNYGALSDAELDDVVGGCHSHMNCSDDFD